MFLTQPHELDLVWLLWFGERCDGGPEWWSVFCDNPAMADDPKPSAYDHMLNVSMFRP